MRIIISKDYKSISASNTNLALNLINDAITALENLGKKYAKFSLMLKPVQLKLLSESKIKQLRSSSTSSSELVFILFILAKLIMYLSKLGDDYNTSISIVKKVISLLSGKK